MSNSIVTDEMVMKALEAERAKQTYGPFDAIRAALEAIADDLVKAEREACAKICDDEDQAIASAGSYNNWAMREDSLKEAAAAIRARTTKDRT